MRCACPPLLVVIACATALAGCGIHDPDQRLVNTRPSTRTSADAPAGAPEATEHDGPDQPLPPRLSAASLAPTAKAALARFARLYVNWAASELPKRAGQLAALSIGQARAEALQVAGRAQTLERYKVTNTGTVVAIAPGQGNEHGRWAVVTDELTSGSGPYLGLPSTSHVTWATVTRQAKGYVVTTWYPAR